MLAPLVAILRTVFGAWNVFVGFVFVFNFPIEQPMGQGEITPLLNQILIATGIFHVVKLVEFVVGLMLVTNRAVPLALCMYFPITVVIFIVNMFLDESGIVGPVVALTYAGTHLFLLWCYRRYYASMLVWKAPLREDRGDEDP